jgi:hypothetical protein
VAAKLRLTIMELVRYLLPHFFAGCVAGVVAAVVLVATNPALHDLVLHTDSGWLGFALLVFGCVVTFSQAAIGAAIMMIGQNDDFQ